MRSHLLLLSVSLTLIACADPLKADEDGDGAAVTVDCDDNDPSVGSVLEDADCDGTTTEEDCDDEDEGSPILAEDGDCDGTPTAEDCDDADPNPSIYVVAEDGDCDGVLTAEDCDDADADLGALAEDSDCDGFLTEDDCDDASSAVNPAAVEICDQIDNNCDGVTDETGTEECVSTRRTYTDGANNKHHYLAGVWIASDPDEEAVEFCLWRGYSGGRSYVADGNYDWGYSLVSGPSPYPSTTTVPVQKMVACVP